MYRIRGLVYFFAAITLLCSCSRHLDTSMPSTLSSTYNTSGYVSVFANNMSALRSRIDEARQAGTKPIFVSLGAPKQQYYFSVYAQLLQTSDLLIARGYGHIFVFRKSDVAEVKLADENVTIADIPIVNAPWIEKTVSGKEPGSFRVGNVSRKTEACPDCVAVLNYTKLFKVIAARWNGKLDPWQQSPRYVAWEPSPAPISSVPPLSVVKPQFVDNGPLHGCPGGTYYVADSGYCYYPWSSPSYPTYYYLTPTGHAYAGESTNNVCSNTTPNYGGYMDSVDRKSVV